MIFTMTADIQHITASLCPALNHPLMVIGNITMIYAPYTDTYHPIHDVSHLPEFSDAPSDYRMITKSPDGEHSVYSVQQCPHVKKLCIMSTHHVKPPCNLVLGRKLLCKDIDYKSEIPPEKCVNNIAVDVLERERWRRWV